MFTVAFNIPAIWELETVRNEHFHRTLENATSGKNNDYALLKKPLKIQYCANKKV